MGIPAGWHDDGSGRLRWWDGAQWTEHVADQQPAGDGYAGAASPEGETPLCEFVSHIDGKNATVRLWHDRIEWERGRGISGGKITAGVLTGGLSLLATGVKGGKDAYEMLPIEQIASVSHRKDGMMYHLVEVHTTAGAIGFRVKRDDAAAFRQAVLDLMQARAVAPVDVRVVNGAANAPQADHAAQLHQLAQLRQAGILTDDEFASKKQEILSRM